MSATAAAQGTDGAASAALARLLGIADPVQGEIGVQIVVEGHEGAWRLGHDVDRPLFVGSATKTFVLAAYLLAVEGGQADLAEPLAVGDDVRSPSSSVLGGLTGTMPARSVLEAMISHSDNTATDMAMKRVGIEAVRAVTARAGLRGVVVPASTRRMISYLAGAAPGVDLGWSGMQAVLADQLPGPPRPVMNETESMIASASALVDWYRDVLAGRLFAQPETLAEFRRISATANALPSIVPPHTAAYGKGGSITWNNENALAVAGQMRIRGMPASFCVALNWQGAPDTVDGVMGALVLHMRALLAAVAARMG